MARMTADLRQQLQHLCASELPPVTLLRQFGKLVKVSGLTLEVVGCQLTLSYRHHGKAHFGGSGGF
jgi:hypothetical protein